MNPSGIIYIFKEPVFTPEQFDRLSNITDNAGNVFLAIGVAGPLFTSVDKPNFVVILSGGVSALIFWSMSLLFARKSKNI